MSKKLCKEGHVINKKDKKLKYECKKCGVISHKEDYCCKPVKITNAA
jgi:hypothetical protein